MADRRNEVGKGGEAACGPDQNQGTIEDDRNSRLGVIDAKKTEGVIEDGEHAIKGCLKNGG